ncbi:hypothetical protein Tco_0423684, partial [Tanacetum coccineum]
MDNRDNWRLDVFGASVISRRHRILCDLGFTFYYFFRRGSSMNRGSLVSYTTSSGNTLQILLRVSNSVTSESSRSRGGIGSDKFGKHVREIGQLILHIMVVLNGRKIG